MNDDERTPDEGLHDGPGFGPVPGAGSGNGAGWRAREQAEKAADRVEATRRSLAMAERREHAWRTGAEGEARTAQVLEQLVDQGWVLIHDVIRPGRQRANIDHLAIGPGGVVVIDSKAWTGVVDVREGVLHQDGRRRPDALSKVSAAAVEVSALLAPHHRRLCTALVCLVGQPTPGQQLAAVPVVGLDELVDQLRARPLYLRADEVAAIAADLHRQLTASRRTRSAGSGTSARPTISHRSPRARGSSASTRAGASNGYGAPWPDTASRAHSPRPAHPVPARAPLSSPTVLPPPIGTGRPIRHEPSLHELAAQFLARRQRRAVAAIRRGLALTRRIVIGIALLWLAATVLPLLISALVSRSHEPASTPTPPKPPAKHQPAHHSTHRSAHR